MNEICLRRKRLQRTFWKGATSVAPQDRPAFLPLYVEAGRPQPDHFRPEYDATIGECGNGLPSPFKRSVAPRRRTGDDFVAAELSFEFQLDML